MTTTRKAVVVGGFVVILLTFGLSALTLADSQKRFETFRTGWAWDLAYYNQWSWSMLFGNRTITVQPMAAYAIEGPSVWKMNYLAPVRFLILPIYVLAPGPRTLLTIQAIVFWWVVPAAFTLVWTETRSVAAALSAACLVPFVPLLWPLACNDFREIQLALPFVIWGVQGVRSRSVWLTSLGLAGMFACRQEMAFVACTFAFLPPREPEDFSRTIRWGRGLLVAGLFWFLLFIFYLRWVVASNAPEFYLEQFFAERAPLMESLRTAWQIAVLGLGGWILLMACAPRTSLLAFPWLWGICGNKFSMRFMETEQWHEVRYAAPFVAMALAGGLVGYARLAKLLLTRRFGRMVLGAIWVGTSVGSAAALMMILGMISYQPDPVPAEEIPAIWKQIDRIKANEGVLAPYEICAPLSSRQFLYSYILFGNRPLTYPKLPPTIHWVFFRREDGATEKFESQGFHIVHRSSWLTILNKPGVEGVRSAGTRNEARSH